MNDAIVISDIHLGSDVCQSKKLIEFLKFLEEDKIQTKELIVNGDLFDSWDFRKLKGSHWKVLSRLRSLAKKIHIVWINGNHDGPAEIISHLLGVDFLEEYILKSEDKNILILHGDIFDNFIAKYPFFTKMADRVYRFIQKVDKSFYLAKLAKKSSKTFLRCSDKIREKAKNYASRKGMNVVICSHTHMPYCDENGAIKYYNTGCWTENPCTFLEILGGEIKLKNFELFNK